MTTPNIPYPGFEYNDFRHRTAQQHSVLLTPSDFEWYEQMLQKHRLFFDPRRSSWLILGYQEVSRVLSDPTIFSSQCDLGPDGQNNSKNGMIGMDPPHHQQIRALVSVAFTPRRVAQLEERITALVHRLLSQVEGNGEMDIVDDLALPLPVLVIAELLGLPTTDMERFQQWLKVIVGGMVGDLALRAQTYISLHQYFQELIEQRRHQPGDDLISALLTAEVDGQHLPVEDVLGTCSLLLLAGHETTANLISNAVLCFDEHPEAWQKLLAHPDLLASALEEVLRYRPPVHMLARLALKDVVVGGEQIKAGELVLPVFAAANRDETQFPNANIFDIRRPPTRHLSFGHGIHFCLGTPLARLEARCAFQALLSRFPRLQRKKDIPLVLKPSWVIYGMEHVPVLLG